LRRLAFSNDHEGFRRLLVSSLTDLLQFDKL
jgi:hypothetical protein